MSYFENELGEEFVDPIRFQDMSNVTPEIIIANMKDICEENGIPAVIYEDEVTIGKWYNRTTYSAIKVSHPNPPQSYCSQLYIIMDNIMRFFFVGESKALEEKNRYEAALAGTGGGFGARLKAICGIEPDEEALEEEMQWHSVVFSVFKDLLY